MKRFPPLPRPPAPSKGLRALAAGLLALAAFPAAAETVLRVIPHAGLKVLDPVWTTAYISRNHGYMIYDTLFAMDAEFRPRPQMVDTWQTSDDGLVWTFRLRPGLKWHDGADVTAADCVASLRRWGARDGMGQELFTAIESLTAADARTIVMKLSEPYGLVLESLAKISSNVPFMMPKRVAETDPFAQIGEHVGSGPFIFRRDEWVPGEKAVYVRNPHYAPRAEPPSAASGGKIARVDRVVWTSYPDREAAREALLNGKADFFETPGFDLIPELEANRGIVVEVNDPLGNFGFLRFNHLIPPFDRAAVRRAAVMAISQEDYLSAAVGDRRFWKTCRSAFPCGTPLADETGAAAGDAAKARAALAAAGYDGTPVVILQPTDIRPLTAFSRVTAEKLRAIGMTVELQPMDWAALNARRARRGAASDGGWNIFHTWWIGADILNPMAIVFSGNREKSWYGWPSDAELEAARSAFARARTPADKRRLAGRVQDRLRAVAVSGRTGQFFIPVAYRANVKGLLRSPVPFFWNVSVE